MNNIFNKKAQSGIITVPLETKVEILLIALFIISATLMMAGIMLNDEYVHNYFKKDVSMVQNTMMMLPYDSKFEYRDHSSFNDMEKISFRLDKFHTYTISKAFKSYKKNGIERYYIHLNNDDVLSYKESYNGDEVLFFEKEYGKFTAGKDNIVDIDNFDCDLESLEEYSEYNIHLDVNDAVYDLVSQQLSRVVKYNAGTILSGKNLYLKITTSGYDEYTIYMPSNDRNDLGCRMYKKFGGDVIYNDRYFMEYPYSVYDEVLIIKVPMFSQSEFFKEIKEVLQT